jgi:hypothetical protein
MNKVSRPVIAAGLFVLFPALSLASLEIADLPSSIPSKNIYLSIDQITPSGQPGIDQFKVTSPHAVYEVQGLRPLAKLVHEIGVIERIRQHDQGSGFFDGASASVEATAQGLGNLVKNPVGSAKGLGKAAGKLSRGVGGMFRKKEEGEKSSFGEKVLGGNEREIAKEFNVDVYTTNPHLRALITQMARSRMGGKSAVLVIKILIPVAAVASIALTAGGINGAADQLVNNASRKDLFRTNKQAVLQMGLSEEIAEGILNSAYFSPREQTYFRFYLEKLQKTENFKTLAETAVKAASEWEARRELYEAEMAAAAAEKTSFTKLWDFPEGLALLNSGGQLMVMTAYDDLSGELENAVIEQIKKIKKESGASSVVLWNGGKIAESFRKRAGREGLETQAWMYFAEGAKNV